MSDMPNDGRDAGTVEQKPRFFGPTNLAINNRVSVLALFAITAIMGIFSYLTIPKESSPEIVIPMVSISTVYPGVAPKDMETLVTRVIEDELNTIPDIRELTSTSVQGYSNVTAEFASDMDVNEALQKVREKVDLAKPELPVDAEDPIISEFNFSDFPILQVNISGQYDLVQLKEVAENLQDELEQIPSILEVRLSGGLEREVKVEVDLAMLKFYGVAFGDVIEAIRTEHVTVPGGGIEVGTQEFLVRVDGEFRDPRLIEDLVITTKAGRPVYVRDVAKVDFGFADRTTFARLDGNPVVTLDIIKRSGENIIETADAVKAVIAEQESVFPPTTVVKLTSDQSSDIREMVASLENNIISGLILVVAVLLFFLGVRNASFVGLSIPTSMLLSFIIMKALGITMNMVVLFSLILALGMLVDNAIVVVENIYRHMEQGFGRFDAARRGTGEVALPIISSTLTTLAAFFPMLFWPDVVGEFMGFLPKTLIITLSSSLFVALVIVPTLCATMMRIDGTPQPPMRGAARWTTLGAGALALLMIAGSSPLAAALLAGTIVGVVALHRVVLARAARWFQDRGMPAIIRWYEGQLRWALRHRALIMGACVAVFVGAVAVFSVANAGVEYFPESIPPAAVYARIDVPAGTSAEFTDDMVRRIEERLGGIDGMEDSESVVATVRASTGGSMFDAGDEGNVVISFVDFDERSADAFETLRRMQETVGEGMAGADVRVEAQQNGPVSGKPIMIELVGPDVEVLRTHADRLVAQLKAAPVAARLEGLESDLARGRPELVVTVDRERAAIYDLSTSEVGMTVRTAIQGSEAGKFRAGKDEYDITVRLAESYRQDLTTLEDLTVVNDGRQIPLSSVASWHVEEGLGEVRRKDLDRVATVSSDVRSGENSNAVLAEVRATLAGFDAQLPPGYSMRFAGQQEDQQEAMAFLGGAFVVALLLIALILMSQFNSVLKPLIIMTSVIMSTVGVLLGLVVFRMPFGIIMTGVGVISLAGIVVNNAIVLIDYIDLLRARGLSRDEALITAGSTRFRPVILTAITTVLGLVPLAIGFNLDFIGLYTSLSPNLYWGGEQAAWWGPMAIAVIAGLSFATVLTLVVVPVLYSVVDDMGLFFKRHFTHAGAQETAAEEPPSRRSGRRRLAAAFGRVDWLPGTRTEAG
ncbi:MAG TPA: efflux RND transporter permease subunit [Gemmatimonadaceae bacterium]